MTQISEVHIVLNGIETILRLAVPVCDVTFETPHFVEDDIRFGDRLTGS